MSERDEVAVRIRAELVRTLALAESLKTTLRLLTGEPDEPGEPSPSPALRHPKKRATRTTQEGVPPGKKRCSLCKKALAVASFGVSRANPDGLMRYCRACTSSYQKNQRGAGATAGATAGANGRAAAKAEEPEPAQPAVARAPAASRIDLIRLRATERKESA